ncbi:MAG: TonB-dependent receptor [Bacteroidetes bacterium]|nr:TonB-dependent receptor [Bacteroidota bacterium]
MKTLLFAFIMTLPVKNILAQTVVKGKVIDGQLGIPIPNATVEVSHLGATLTDDSGFFEFRKTNMKKIEIKATSIGYRIYEANIEVNNEMLSLPLEPIQLFLQPVEVKALRAGEKAPFTKTNISEKEIKKTNLGQDLPFLLGQTPSVVINSDAGNGVGYTGIYIRGTDATRINMTLNGIPYNDAEDQSIYFVDLPDFASSVNSIQIQRGVGTSSNGAGAFGATINFSTNEFNDKAYAEINNSYGSFNTWKNTVKAGSGLINDHFTLDARLSRISSDGYIDRATSNLKSFYLSAAYYCRKSSFRFNIISGYEKTYQAWNGIPEAKLEGDKAALDQHYNNNRGSLYFTQADSLNLYNSNNRTYNYFSYKNQTDNYWQNHYQLFFNHQVNQQLSFNVAGFLTRGYGYYEEYKNAQPYSNYGLSPYVAGNDTVYSTDLIRQKWLANYFYGGIFSLQYKNKGALFVIGGGWDRYDGKHYGLVNWSQNGGMPTGYEYYNVPAHKTDFNLYAKLQQKLNRYFTAFADLQFRTINYHINGFEDNSSLFVNPKYNFINPKAGISYANHEWQSYFSYSLGNHEPNRGDFEANQNELPKPEKLHDFELGIAKKNSQYSFSATGYYMLYKNQLVLNGKINNVGEYTRANIPDSYRLGLELEGSIKLTGWLNAAANMAFSRNKVKNYTEYIDDYDNGGQKNFSYQKTDIAFSPSIVGGASVNFLPIENFELDLIGKYVSKEYLDNAQKENRKLNGYYVQNLRMSYTVKSKTISETNFIFQANNLFNKKYEPNGYTYSYFYGGSLITENFLFPMATTNFMFAVNIKL